MTADAAALCLRSGNVALLRCGSDCLSSSLAIHAAMVEGLEAAGLPADAIQLIDTPDRAAVGALLTGLEGTIDLLIPRGGKSLVARVQAEARVPVLGHLEGLNHTYVHAAADPEMAEQIVLNAKMRRVSVCGATETLLIDRACAPALLPRLAGALQAAGCSLRGDADSRALVPSVTVADEQDWTTEYLAPVLAVRVVDDLEQAVDHIRRYGSGHTEAIVTEDADAAADFLTAVDSAIVMWNASTQFADGGEFGFGGEIGIATSRLHARGPVGAEQLTSYKYVRARHGPDPACLADRQVQRLRDVQRPLAEVERHAPIRKGLHPHQGAGEVGQGRLVEHPDLDPLIQVIGEGHRPGPGSGSTALSRPARD